MKKVFVTDYNCITSLGFGVKENMSNILDYKTGIEATDFSFKDNCFVAKINDRLLQDKFMEIESSNDYSRIEKMSILALFEIIKNNKIGKNDQLIVSTTKGDIKSIENQNITSKAYLYDFAERISNYFGFVKPPIIVSNACVSGVMAMATAKKIIQNSDTTNIYILAVDELSNFVISGFNCFQALSSSPCKPYDINRDGVSIGEAAVSALITSTVSKIENKITFEILGESSINDANHISGPSRTGEGLYLSIYNALKESKIETDEIDFISAHGTATPFNDEMESIAFDRLNLSNTPTNSLKGYYGHTLGASGLLELIISIEASKQNKIIATLGYQESGTTKPMAIFNKHLEKETNYFLKTASGFGGSNSAIILKKVS